MRMDAQSAGEKFAALEKKITGQGRILIAFSGGVDSAVLAHLARAENPLCVFVLDETVSKEEYEQAKTTAAGLGVQLQVLEHSIMDEEFCKNTVERCYHCKKAMIGALKEFARKNGINCIAMGITTSDFKEYRPGIKAGYEEGIWYPFVDFGISKEEVREYARKQGLGVAEKPANACLASRIAYNQKITTELLMRVDAAEKFLHGLGFKVVRVRVHGNDARIELGKNEFAKAFSTDLLQRIAKKLHELGFVHVSLDMDGYRPGSMNEGITQPQIGQARGEKRH
ncbi:MAG: ATP-dependent sacrificial sulfur transferase LarE [Thermoplasmata archaeon]|nr:ATP-dependent sacrificial sulfur transferase LarE [Thermoplasmata archaeon]